MRIAKFLAVFVLVTGLVYLVVFGLNFNVFKTVFTNQEALAEGSEWIEKTYSLAGMTEFVAAHPDLVSVVLLSMDTTSTRQLSFQPLTPRAMGATTHFLLLLAYAEAVELGEVAPSQEVELQRLERFVVPGHEPNRHRESLLLLSQLGLADEGLTTLDAIVRLMVTRNHQPSADYVYHLLGSDRVTATVRKWLGDQAELPLTWSAFYTAATLDMLPYDAQTNRARRDRLAEQARIVFEQLDSESMSVTGLLPEDRKNDVAYTFFEEKALYRLHPHVIPDHLARTMLHVLTDPEFPGRNMVMEHMRWPMENPEIMRDFSDVGAVFDSRIAVSNGVSFGTSAYTGETFASVTFFDQLPVGFWMHMSSNLINQDFQLRMKFDPAMFERTAASLNTN